MAFKTTSRNGKRFQVELDIKGSHTKLQVPQDCPNSVQSLSMYVFRCYSTLLQPFAFIILGSEGQLKTFAQYCMHDTHYMQRRNVTVRQIANQAEQPVTWSSSGSSPKVGIYLAHSTNTNNCCLIESHMSPTVADFCSDKSAIPTGVVLCRRRGIEQLAGQSLMLLIKFIN